MTSKAPLAGLITNELVYADGEVSPLGIAWHLALEGRFANALRRHWSSAHHSVFVADLVEVSGGGPLATMYGLMHDVTDAFMRDIPSPCKTIEQALAEERAASAIWTAWGLPERTPEVFAAVAAADRQALLAEAQLFAAPVIAANLLEKHGPARPEDVVRAEHLGRVFQEPAAAWLYRHHYDLNMTALPVSLWLASYARLRTELGLPAHSITARTP
ncbi:MAG: hypothetical protein Q8S13_14015 [Dehalococcoidia bacterium]|nr:hypothetical protein [Dehalococcoidia bacterium]